MRHAFVLPVVVALVVLVTNVALSFAWVAVYSYAIHPGETAEFYGEYAQRAAPVCSVVAGAPLMFLAGRWLASRGPRELATRRALTVWAVYAAIDLVALAATPFSASAMGFVTASLGTKLLAVSWGARSR